VAVRLPMPVWRYDLSLSSAGQRQVPEDRSLNQVRSRVVPSQSLPAGSGLQQALMQCDRVQRMAESAFSEADFEKQLKHWLFALVQSLSANAAWLALGSRELRIVAAMGPWPAIEGTDVPTRSGMTARVLAERDMAVEIAIQIEPETHDSLRDCLLAGVPLSWNGHPQGVLMVWLPSGRTYPERELRILRMAAMTLAQHLHGAELLARERHRAARFELIADVARMVGVETERDALLQRAADAIHRTLGYPAIDIPTIEDEAPQQLTIRVRGGHYKNAIPHIDRVPIDRGIMGAAVLERRTQCVNDVASDPRYIKPPNVDPPQAELAVPILVDGAVRGVINVESPRRFSPLDVTTIENVAGFLGDALRRVQRLQQERDDEVGAERARVAGDVQKNLSQLLVQVHMLADTLEPMLRVDPEKAANRCQRLRELTSSAQRELRALLQRSAPGP
jgi:GAF domain-containing protein